MKKLEKIFLCEAKKRINVNFFSKEEKQIFLINMQRDKEYYGSKIPRTIEKNFDNLEGNNCFISPKGKFISIPFEFHETLACAIVRWLTNRRNNQAVSYLENTGWLHISAGSLPEYVSESELSKITTAQIDTLIAWMDLSPSNRAPKKILKFIYARSNND